MQANVKRANTIALHIGQALFRACGPAEIFSQVHQSGNDGPTGGGLWLLAICFEAEVPGAGSSQILCIFLV